ncbi:MAG: DUF2225 domain-containing protein [Crocinitomicaceae bacterium]|nr:DUF2225 domain-containing protein [Crocinitomicaceae bacterium]
MIRFFSMLPLIVSMNAVAHTSYKSEIKCPLDGKKFDIYITGSYTTTNTLKDFQKQGYIGDLYESSVVSCPNCHYSGYVSDFDTSFTKDETGILLNLLQPFESEKPDDVMENEIAVQLYLHWKKPMNEIAWLYLMASYFLKGVEDRQEKRKELQQLCIDYTLLAIDGKEYEKKEMYAVEYYLVGELYRRIGNFESALKYFDLAEETKPKPDWLEPVLKEQREMALNSNDDNSI